MGNGDFGIECENCECLICNKNDELICKNCSECNGSLSYNKWSLDCEKYETIKNPEENIKIILRDIN